MPLIDLANEIIGDIAVPAALIYSPSRDIGGLVADITLREVHTDEDTITVNPVETGTPISDHVYANPQLIEIQCGFSDSTAGYAGYVQDVYQEFLALKATRQPFSVSTGKRQYTDMLLGNIMVVTDETAENALMVTARLQQVIITSTTGSAASQTNQANPQQTSPSSNVGTQAAQPALSSVPTFVQSQSLFDGTQAVPIGGGNASGAFLG